MTGETYSYADKKVDGEILRTKKITIGLRWILIVMTTQKKVNRKRNVHCIVLFILFSLVGCSTLKEQLLEDDFRFIKYGMEKKRLK